MTHRVSSFILAPQANHIADTISVNGTFRSVTDSVVADMQAIDRAFTVLRAVASRPGTSTLADVTKAAELPKSTVLRLLLALEAQGAVQTLGGRYAIGPGLAVLSHQTNPASALKELARPHLAALVEEVQENAALAIADGSSALYVDTAMTDSSVTVQDWTDERLPFHASAAGLALMSTWDDSQLVAYAGDGLNAFTDSTIVTLEGLRERMAAIRVDGVAWTMHEFSDDVNGVGAPILDADGNAIGAINIYGPDYRFPGERRPTSIVTPLLEACAKITARLA